MSTEATGSVQVVDNTEVPQSTEGQHKLPADATLAALAAAKAPKEAERPAWLPAEFKTAEEFGAAWNAKQTPETPKVEVKGEAKAPAVDPLAELTLSTPAETEAKATAAGVDLAKLQTEFSTDGKLSDATYADLAAKGFSKANVDAVIASKQAASTSLVDTLATHVGSKESLQDLVTWAAKTLPADELTAFNKMIRSGDVGTAKLAVDGIKSKHEAVFGTEPEFVNGVSKVGPGIKPFADMAEVSRAMATPEYRNNDRAYHEMIQKRLMVSKF